MMDENIRKHFKTPYGYSVDHLLQMLEQIDEKMTFNSYSEKTDPEIQELVQLFDQLSIVIEREKDLVNIQDCGKNTPPSRRRPGTPDPDTKTANPPYVKPKETPHKKTNQLVLVLTPSENEPIVLLENDDVYCLISQIDKQDTFIESQIDKTFRDNYRSEFIEKGILYYMASYTFELDNLKNNLINKMHLEDIQLPVLELNQNSLMYLLYSIDALNKLKTYMLYKIKQNRHQFTTYNQDDMAFLLSNIDALYSIMTKIKNRISNRNDLIQLFGEKERNYLFPNQDGQNSFM